MKPRPYCAVKLNNGHIAVFCYVMMKAGEMKVGEGLPHLT